MKRIGVGEKIGSVPEWYSISVFRLGQYFRESCTDVGVGINFSDDFH